MRSKGVWAALFVGFLMLFVLVAIGTDPSSPVKGSLAVAAGDQVVPVCNEYLARFAAHRLPVFATRCWHTPAHCSFAERGGPWPPHCIAGTPGARFPPELQLPEDVFIISKGTSSEADAYSAFEGTHLGELLRAQAVRRVFVGGLATDYCVLNTVSDALARGYQSVLLEDAIRAVNVKPGDGERAIEQMLSAGAQVADLQRLRA